MFTNRHSLLLAIAFLVSTLEGMSQNALPAISSDSLPIAHQIRIEPLKLLHILNMSRCVSRVIFAPDGKTLAIACENEPALKLWTIGLETAVLSGHTKDVNDLAFSPDGKFLVSSSYDSTVKLWDVANKSNILSLNKHIGGSHALRYSSDGTRYASFANNTIIVWDAATATPLSCSTIKAPQQSFCAAFSPSCDFLALGSETYVRGKYTFEIKFLETKTGTCTHTATGHDSAILFISFNPDGKTLVSCSDDKTIKLWDLRSGTCIKTFAGHVGSARSATFSPDNKTLASGSDDRTIKIWDIKTGTCLQTLTAHQSAVLSLGYSPDGRMLASGSGDYTVKIWQI